MARKVMECPVCGISVKIENIEKHLKNVHPGKEVDEDELDLPVVKKPRRARRGRPAPGWVKWAAVIVVVVAIIAIAAYLGFPEEESPEPNYAPLFQVTDVDGNVFNLQQRIGPSPILIEFFNPYGDNCKDMAPVMNNVSAHFGNSLLILSLTDNIEQGARYFRDTYDSDWIFAHTSSSVLQDYGVSGLPHFFLIDEKGIIRWDDTGVLSFDYLKDAIDDWM